VKRIAKWLKPEDLLGLPTDLPDCPASTALREEFVQEYLQSKLGLIPKVVIEVQSTARLCTQNSIALMQDFLFRSKWSGF
jgi:hypothetical protein